MGSPLELVRARQPTAPLKNIPLPWLALTVWASSRKDKAGTQCAVQFVCICGIIFQRFLQICSPILRQKQRSKQLNFPMLPNWAIVMVKDALLPAGIKIHIVFILAGQGGGKTAEWELFSLPIWVASRAGWPRSWALGRSGSAVGIWATQLPQSVQVLTPPLPFDTAEENRPPPPPCRKQNRAIVWLWVLLSSPRH